MLKTLDGSKRFSDSSKSDEAEEYARGCGNKDKESMKGKCEDMEDKDAKVTFEEYLGIENVLNSVLLDKNKKVLLHDGPLQWLKCPKFGPLVDYGSPGCQMGALIEA